MKKILYITTLFALGVFSFSTLSAEKYKGATNSNSSNGGITNGRVAAACLPGKSSTELDLNNVRARIMTGGDMWWDLQTNPKYYIPKNSTKTSMFSASLWLGGLDVNGQLKGAFQRYRGSGNDFWPGPLTDDGKASTSSEVCDQYDKHFNIYRSQVSEFLIKYNNPDYPDYAVPEVIKNWPAHGDVSKNQNYYLAPFFDTDGDGSYDYTQGDYPYYDLDNELCYPKKDAQGHYYYEPTMEGNGILVDQVLKGDQTLWWVFNDNGNFHSESKGNAIGVEIRAQAFAFSTSDEINNMTFYTYEIINRSTYRLTETYFSQWVDTDLGYAKDDYVGCDVMRGLGYCYNGKAIDGNGTPEAYGAQPPAVGVDFFQGPYMDNDQDDNPSFYIDGNGVAQNCNEAINGVNFGDGIIDNERFGMRKFLFHNNTGGLEAMTDPDLAAEYYQLLTGYWKDGTKMMYGGNAHVSDPAAQGPACSFMFPDETDPCNWGTNGQLPVGPKKWTEETESNAPFDRRFMQSAGPFTLEPGAVNYITVGIPWARATSGGAFASVELLRKVDDKCQALFDNCFKVLDGPDAPELTIQELDQELILYISNIKGSNNFGEKYFEYDVTIPPLNDEGTPSAQRYDSLYRFQGYQIFQLVDDQTSVTDIYDLDKARLVAQCDIKDGVGMIVNVTKDDKSGINAPQIMVDGGDEGIVHSFKISEDKFATGSTALVNHKKYYYVAVAYAYNNFLTYEEDPGNPNGLNGQKKPYLAGRKGAIGPIQVITAIPHLTSPENGGTIINANYGERPIVTRVDGKGNGGLELDITDEMEAEILASGKVLDLTYAENYSPIDVKVIDPLNVVAADFRLNFVVRDNQLDTARWVLISGNDTIAVSDTTIKVANEQLLLDYGISIAIGQGLAAGSATAYQNGLINATMEFDDISNIWLTGVPDVDGSTAALNWIRSGTLEDPNESENDDYKIGSTFIDGEEYFEKMLGGTWTAYRLASKFEDGPAHSMSIGTAVLSNLHSVDVVFTSDKSKWTRCPVIETGDDKTAAEGNRDKFDLRAHQSIDRDGNYSVVGSGANPTDKDAPNFVSETGMGWFPGYAIDLETGERLNMMFGESSWLVGENGRDMIFNPTSNYFTPIGDVLFGGKHFLYVFRHSGDIPAYEGDYGKTVHDLLASTNYNPTLITMLKVYGNIMWTSIPMAASDATWLQGDARVKLRVSVPYQRYTEYTSTPQVNDGWPAYEFSTKNMATTVNANETAKTALDLINVVPNPYKAYSAYETNQLDNRVKITNLPENCTVKIFSVNGTLVRTLTKDNDLTYIEWDLKNHANIPISSGVYLIHINAPGIGEKVIKWFGVLRPVDLNAF